MTAKDIFNGSTGNRATFLILDANGFPRTGVAFNASGLSVSYRINTGSAVSVTLTSGNWFETGGGKYYVDVPDSVYAVGNLGALVQFYGSLTDCGVYGEQHRVVAYNPLAVAMGANTTTPPTAAAIADATLSSLKTGPSTGGNWPTDSFGRGLLVGSQPQREVLVTGNGHVASTIHSVQTDAITGDGIAASGITKIAAGVWSALISGFNVAGSTGEVVKALASMLEFVGGLWRWKASSLTQAPSGTNVVTVLPASGIAAGRGETTSLVAYVGETISQSIGVYQADGTTAYDLSGKTLTIIFESLKTGDDVAVVASGSITISGASNNTVTFSYPSAATSSQRELGWVLRDEAAPKTVYLRGTLEVRYAPTVG